MPHLQTKEKNQVVKQRVSKELGALRAVDMRVPIELRV